MWTKTMTVFLPSQKRKKPHRLGTFIPTNIVKNGGVVEPPIQIRTEVVRYSDRDKTDAKITGTTQNNKPNYPVNEPNKLKCFERNEKS